MLFKRFKFNKYFLNCLRGRRSQGTTAFVDFNVDKSNVNVDKSNTTRRFNVDKSNVNVDKSNVNVDKSNMRYILKPILMWTNLM